LVFAVVRHPSQAPKSGRRRRLVPFNDIPGSAIDDFHLTPVKAAVSFAVSRAWERVSRITNGERRGGLITKISNILLSPRR
jgi:hypothetical protein